MAPELPIEIADPSKSTEATILREAPCSMVRFGVRCNNAADMALLYPAVSGVYIAVAICDMCLEEWRP